MPRAPRRSIGLDLLVVVLKEEKKEKKLDSGISFFFGFSRQGFSV